MFSRSILGPLLGCALISSPLVYAEPELSTPVAMAIPEPDTSLLTGDVRLACEAILCLSSGVRPGECSPSLRRYFNIEARKWSDTYRLRRNFLSLCPAASESRMPELVSAIAGGAGRCDMDYLLEQLNGWCGDDYSTYRCMTEIPSYCGVYYDHEYTRIQLPEKTRQCRPLSDFPEYEWQGTLPLGYEREGREACTDVWVRPAAEPL